MVQGAAVQLSDVSVNFGAIPALLGLNADLAIGSLTAVVGPNGAGKSTLLKTVVGEVQPVRGRVSFGALKRSEVAYLPQHSTIERAVDRLLFIHDGRVAWEGTPEEFTTSEVPLVKQFATGSLNGPIACM